MNIFHPQGVVMKEFAFALAASSLFLLGTAHAVESNITREAIEAASPIMLKTLMSIETAQGCVIADKDLRGVLQSPEFSRQYQVDLRKWCAIASNARAFACTSDPALSAAPQLSTKSGDNPVDSHRPVQQL